MYSKEIKKRKGVNKMREENGMNQESKFKSILERLEFDDVVVLKGKLFNFQGNVVAVDLEEEYFELYITHSDDEDAIGMTLPISDGVMSNMFYALEIKRFERPREDILALINFAIDIGDKDWFMDLTEQLNNYDARKKFLKSRRMAV